MRDDCQGDRCSWEKVLHERQHISPRRMMPRSRQTHCHTRFVHKSMFCTHLRHQFMQAPALKNPSSANQRQPSLSFDDGGDAMSHRESKFFFKGCPNLLLSSAYQSCTWHVARGTSCSHLRSHLDIEPGTGQRLDSSVHIAILDIP